MEHILGDIKVSESDDWVQEHVLVWVNKTFSHPDVQDVIDFKVVHDSLFKNPILTAGLNSTDPTERERHVKLMKNHCARIDVEFVFPKYSGNTLRLFARTHKGDIRVRTEGPTMVFKELHLETQVGDVFFEAGTVQTSTSIKTGRGKVQGTVRTLEQVEVTTTTGDIALRVDTKPGYHGSDTKNLNITLQSTKSSIDLELVRQYNGWFSLMSGIDRPTFGLSPDYKDFIRISSSTATSLSGWVWDGFSGRKDLPSVSATASSGTVHAQVLSKPKK
ncbi:hypothetical protein BGZ97_004245 [Linnemannia gamsii]|uniref:Uncharacterized protein n=1 Tax=Linnemannia gamsii TaxID=64522 RepID=A0A9P6UH49_9FUNG|nr:hypothetical protein BGZ97_004245 [Linnemannia gamsii]